MRLQAYLCSGLSVSLASLLSFLLEAPNYENFFMMPSSFHHVGAIQCQTKMGPYQGVLMHGALAWQRVIGRWTPLVTLLFFLVPSSSDAGECPGSFPPSLRARYPPWIFIAPLMSVYTNVEHSSSVYSLMNKTT